MGEPASPDLWKVWAFLFLLIGPIKIIAPFDQLTAGFEPAEKRRVALRAILYAAAIVLIAGTLGVTALRRFGIPHPVLALTGGLVLFLVALLTLIEQVRPREAPPPVRSRAQLPATPLAYPIIVTPTGIAAIIIFMSLAQPWESKGLIGAFLLGILLLDLLVMWFAEPVQHWLGMPLMVFGTVLGVVQAALGLNIMLVALRTLGVVGGAS